MSSILRINIKIEAEVLVFFCYGKIIINTKTANFKQIRLFNKTKNIKTSIDQVETTDGLFKEYNKLIYASLGKRRGKVSFHNISLMFCHNHKPFIL